VRVFYRLVQIGQPVYDDRMGRDKPQEPLEEGVNRNGDNHNLGDAEFNEDDEVFEGGVLPPAKGQKVDVDEVRAKVESLYTQPEAPLLPIEEVVSGAENKAELEFAVENIIEPYIGVFSDKIPPVSVNRRDRDGHTEPVEWTAHETAGEHEFEYQFGLTYTAERHGNAIDHAHVRIDSEHGFNLALALGYTRGVLTEVELAYESAHVYEQRRGQPPRHNDYIGERGLDGAAPLFEAMGHWYHAGAVLLDLTRLRIEGRNVRPDLGIQPYRMGEPFYEFAYNPSGDTFDRVAYDDQGRKDDRDWMSSLSRTEFLTLLEDFLKILPVRHQE
jgi:hypothetical protein